MLTKSSEQSPFLTLGLSQSEAKQSERTIALPEQITKWKLEPELAGPIPRRIVLEWGYIAGAVVIAVAGLYCFWIFLSGEAAQSLWLKLFSGGFSALSLAGLFGWDLERRHSRLLVGRGTATRGIIVEVTGYLAHTPRGTPVRRYKCVIAFDTPARHYVKLHNEYSERKVGDTLTILYLPEAPERAMPYMRCCYKAVAAQRERGA